MSVHLENLFDHIGVSKTSKVNTLASNLNKVEYLGARVSRFLWWKSTEAYFGRPVSSQTTIVLNIGY